MITGIQVPVITVKSTETILHRHTVTHTQDTASNEQQLSRTATSPAAARLGQIQKFLQRNSKRPPQRRSERMHASTASEEDGTSPPLTSQPNITGRSGAGGGGVAEEVQRPTYRTASAYCLENTDGWCAGSTPSLSRDHCARWWQNLNYHSVWQEEGEGKRSVSRASSQREQLAKPLSSSTVHSAHVCL